MSFLSSEYLENKNNYLSFGNITLTSCPYYAPFQPFWQ